MKDLLYEKFAAVPTRPGRGGTYSYIKWQDVADRMNKIFGINWSSEVVYQDVIGTNVVVRVRVTVSDSVTNNKFSQEGFGGAPMDDRQEAGNPFKAAYSKALKDACKKWGIGLYLDEEFDSGASSDAQVIQNKPSSSIPMSPNTAPAVPTESAVPAVPTAPKTVVPGVVQTPKNTVPVSNIPPTGIVPPSNIPPTNTVTVPIKQVKVEQKTSVTPEVPNIPPQHTSKAPEIAGDRVGISDVQKAALHSIISIQGVEYNQLVKEAFTLNNIELSGDAPLMEELSYKEAVMVVKHGSDKFRKR